jgi:hypothetical protein
MGTGEAYDANAGTARRSGNCRDGVFEFQRWKGGGTASPAQDTILPHNISAV